jgi:hypothetical protein
VGSQTREGSLTSGKRRLLLLGCRRRSSCRSVLCVWRCCWQRGRSRVAPIQPRSPGTRWSEVARLESPGKEMLPLLGCLPRWGSRPKVGGWTFGAPTPAPSPPLPGQADRMCPPPPFLMQSRAAEKSILHRMSCHFDNYGRMKAQWA